MSTSIDFVKKRWPRVEAVTVDLDRRGGRDLIIGLEDDDRPPHLLERTTAFPSPAENEHRPVSVAVVRHLSPRQPAGARMLSPAHVDDGLERLEVVELAQDLVSLHERDPPETRVAPDLSRPGLRGEIDETVQRACHAR